jgi:RNA polymerase sigma factor (TIGR02999 family)
MHGHDDDPREITRLLHELDEGREGALDELMALVYQDLKRIAGKHMRREFGANLGGVTLQPTALVNEGYLKLIQQRKSFRNRAQFFALATKILIRTLIDYQRSRGREKRAGDQIRVSLSGLDPSATHEPDVSVLDLADVLERLEQLDERKANVVKLRAIWGLTVTEIATTLGSSVATVERDWSFAKRWIASQLSDRPDDQPTDSRPRSDRTSE